MAEMDGGVMDDRGGLVESQTPDTYSAEAILIAGSSPFTNIDSNITGSYWAANSATSLFSPGRFLVLGFFDFYDKNFH